MYKTILLVDDDADDTELFAEALGEIDAGITWYSAIDGQEALDKLHNDEISKPDIIFLDINMPGMDGWQCLTQLKGNDHFRHIPVIMYSTSAAQKEMQLATQMGALGFLSKPADYSMLKKALQRLTNQSSEEGLQRSIEQLNRS